MPAPDEERDYPCDECERGVMTLKRYGIFVSGRCNCCRHYVEFELPDEATGKSVLQPRLKGLGVPESHPVHN